MPATFIRIACVCFVRLTCMPTAVDSFSSINNCSSLICYLNVDYCDLVTSLDNISNDRIFEISLLLRLPTLVKRFHCTGYCRVAPYIFNCKQNLFSFLYILLYYDLSIIFLVNILKLSPYILTSS